MLGVIFRKAQNRIQYPAKLRWLVADLIDREQWMALDGDVKGDAYEGLRQKNAEDVTRAISGRSLIVEPGADGDDPGLVMFGPAQNTGHRSSSPRS